MGRNSGGGGRSATGSGLRSQSNLMAASARLLSKIQGRGTESTSRFKKGDLVLVGRGIGRITKITDKAVHYNLIDPRGGKGVNKMLPRFSGQSFNRVTKSELSRAQRLAKRLPDSALRQRNILDDLAGDVGRYVSAEREFSRRG